MTDQVQPGLADMIERHSHGPIRQAYERTAKGVPIGPNPVITECACGEEFSGSDMQETIALWAAHVASALTSAPADDVVHVLRTTELWRDMDGVGTLETYGATERDFQLLAKTLTAQPSPLPVGENRPELTVWYGEMPESNGRRNWTASLHRKGGNIHQGEFCFARSEYPDRVRYEADRMRWIIGELSERPDILAYDADLHSGYVEPTQPEQPAESAVGEVLPEYGEWLPSVWDTYLIELVGDRMHGWARLPATFRWHEFHERLGRAIAALQQPQGDVRELVERLRKGVIAIGLHDDNETELFDIEDADDTMHEAADMLERLVPGADAIEQARAEERERCAAITDRLASASRKLAARHKVQGEGVAKIAQERQAERYEAASAEIRNLP